MAEGPAEGSFVNPAPEVPAHLVTRDGGRLSGAAERFDKAMKDIKWDEPLEDIRTRMNHLLNAVGNLPAPDDINAKDFGNLPEAYYQVILAFQRLASMQEVELQRRERPKN